MTVVTNLKVYATTVMHFVVLKIIIPGSLNDKSNRTWKSMCIIKRY